MWRFVVVAVVACHAAPSTPPPPTCAQVADHMRALSETRARRHDEPDDGTTRQVRDAFAARCTADAWPADAMRCIVDEPEDANHHCKERLTAPQRTALDADLGRIFKPIASADAYKAEVIAEIDQVIVLMQGDDCGKIASDLAAFTARTKRKRESAEAWKTAHPDDAKRLEQDIMSTLMQKMEPLIKVAQKCEHDPAFSAAMKALK